jgi:hypothetical protein
MEGKKIVFVARQNGLQNLYYTEDLFKTVHRLTHTDTAIFDGTIDERVGQVYTTIMTGRGQQIASAPFSKEGYNTPPKEIKPLLQERYSQGLNSPPEDADLEKEFGSLLDEKRPYASLGYLRPRYWLPFIFVTDTGYGTQISTSSFDPLQKHAYSLQAGYDSYVRESTLGMNYVNMTTNWPFVLGISSINRNQPNINYEFSAQQLNFMMMHDLRPWSDRITIGVGATGRTIRSTSTVKRVGPQFAFIYDGSGKSAFSEVPFNGYQFSFFGNHFLKNDDRAEFSRGILNTTYFHSKLLPEKHIALIHAIAQQSQNTKLIAEYTPSDSFYLVQDFSAPRFVLRGYEQGYFYFWNARGLTFEYHLPIAGARGWSTLPAFLKRTRLNLFADAMAVDGFYSDYQAKKYEYTSLSQIYRSYGAELKTDFTFGYYLPATLILGLCQRPDYSGPDKSTLMIGFQI